MDLDVNYIICEDVGETFEQYSVTLTLVEAIKFLDQTELLYPGRYFEIYRRIPKEEIEAVKKTLNKGGV